MWWNDVIRFHLSQVAGCSIHGIEPPGSIEGREILEWLLVSERLWKCLSLTGQILRKLVFWASFTFISYMNRRTCAYDKVRPEMTLAVNIGVILAPWYCFRTEIRLTLNIPRGVLRGPPVACYWLTSVEINKHKIFDTNNAWITEL